MHKHTLLTTKPEASNPDVKHQAEAAEARSIAAAGRSEAEQVTDALRAARAAKITLAPKEARAQRIAAMAGKLEDLKNVGRVPRILISQPCQRQWKRSAVHGRKMRNAPPAPAKRLTSTGRTGRTQRLVDKGPSPTALPAMANPRAFLCLR